MPITLDDTIGGDAANTYILLDDAIGVAALLADMKFYGVDTSGWSVASAESKAEALAAAAERIDTLNFIGTRQAVTQARQWPRMGTGKTQTDGVIPDRVKWGQVAEACGLLASPSQEAGMQSQGVSSYTIAKKSVAFGSTKTAGPSDKVSGPAEKILRGSGLVQGRVASVYIPRA